MILNNYSSSGSSADSVVNNGSVFLFAAILSVAVFIGLIVGVGLGFYAVLLVLVCVSGLAVVFDYRVGVFLLVLMLALSMTELFPRKLLGVTGLNPLNIIFLAVCASIILAHKFRIRVLSEVLPKELLIYLIIPCLFALAIGAPQIGKIPGFMYVTKLVIFETWPGYVIDSFVKPFMQVGVAILIAIYVANGKRTERIMLVVTAGAVALASITLVMLALSGLGLGALARDDAGMRGALSFTGLHANSLGLMFNLCLALHLFAIPAPQPVWQRAFTIFGAFVCSVMVAMTFSRAGIVAMGFLIVMFLVSTKRFVPLFIGSLAVIVGLFFLPDAFYNRLLTGVANRDLHSISAGRLDMIWQPLLQIIPDNLIFGNGLSSVLWSTPLVTGRMLAVGHAHNAYLNTLLDMGIVGLVLVLLFYRFVFKEINRVRQTDPDPYFRQFVIGVQAGLVLLLIQGISGDNLIPSPSQVYLWCGIGIILGRRAVVNRIQLSNSLKSCGLAQ